jgi:hypothetical protein
MLKYGPFSNYSVFKKKLAMSRLINDKKYYVPLEINHIDYDLTHDMMNIEKGRLRDTHKSREKENDNMFIDRTSVHAYILTKLSKESLDEFSRH